jgi:hypothetical protein
MHEEIRISIDFQQYNTAFSSWKRTNKDKSSIEFDKEIGIGSWKKIDKKSTVAIKDKRKFFLAQLKYSL